MNLAALTSNTSVSGQVLDDLVSVLIRYNTDPEIVYATKRCGFVMTDYNEHSMSTEQKAKWMCAIKEYHSFCSIKH
jgi:hypothetical protein